MANKKLRPCNSGEYWSAIVTAMYLAEALIRYERENKRAPAGYIRLANTITKAVKEFQTRQADDESVRWDASYTRTCLADQLAKIIQERRRKRKRISREDYEARTRSLLRSREVSLNLYREGIQFSDGAVTMAIAPDWVILDAKWPPKRLAVDLLRKALGLPSPRKLEGLRKRALHGWQGLEVPVSSQEVLKSLFIFMEIPVAKAEAATKTLLS